MGRRSGLGRTVRAGLAVSGRIPPRFYALPLLLPPGQHKSGAGRNRSGGRRVAAGPFSTQPSGPRPVGCFSVRRPQDSLGPYRSRYGRFARALKNSQLIRASAGRNQRDLGDGTLDKGSANRLRPIRSGIPKCGGELGLI